MSQAPGSSPADYANPRQGTKRFALRQARREHRDHRHDRIGGLRQ